MAPSTQQVKLSHYYWTGAPIALVFQTRRRKRRSPVRSQQFLTAGKGTTSVIVLSAKLRPPSAGGLRRPRLLQLVAGCDVRVLLITAPAGSGKTTLLGQMIEQVDGPVAWLRPDITETSSEGFVGHLMEA